MKKLKIKKMEKKKLIWWKFRKYIDFTILVCCVIIAFNIHPYKINEFKEVISDWSKMVYVFHDYEWNEYVLNDNVHWASNSWDYLFDDEVPNDIKWEDKHFSDWVSIWDLMNQYENEDINVNSGNDVDEKNDIKDNQITIDEMMTDLWFSWVNTDSSDLNPSNDENSDKFVINVWNQESENENSYIVKEQDINDNPTLIIEKIGNEWKNENNESKNSEINKNANSEQTEQQFAKAFTFIDEGWVLPTLVSRNDLYFGHVSNSLDYFGNNSSNGNNGSNNWYNTNNGGNKKWWVTIIAEYSDCMTPWWYKISHWDSVLAYQQLKNAPDICNIERRYCRKWKLSWTYTQQWCSVNKNYSYEEWWGVEDEPKNLDWSKKQDEQKWWTRQNPDGSVSVANSEIWWSFVFDRPNNTSSDFNYSDNIRWEQEEVSQTKRPDWYCVTPRGEIVNHGQFIQAFKHENWFSDAPCQAQIRLCTLWELLWTYTESTCKTWDTSFVDWVNGSPTRDTYSKEKLELIKKRLKDEENDYNKKRKQGEKATTSDSLDRILWILDQD